MKAVVFHGIGDIRLDDVPEPKLKDATDAIVRITASAICGTDLHFIRGTMSGVKKGRILGHEAVGIVEEVGKGVRNLRAGDRVVVPSTVGCGYCSYCRAGYFAQCDNAHPDGKRGGTVFFGGPEDAGGLDGLQAELARVPFANVGLVKLPAHVTDDQAIMLSDIFPTAYFGAELAEIEQGDTVCVLGCGPVGQFAIASAKMLGAGRVFAVDCVADRLEMARMQGAEVVNFEKEDPTEIIVELTGGIGVDRLIDAVGIDAQHAHHGPAGRKAKAQLETFAEEQQTIAPEQNPQGANWHPGDAPSQALRWGVELLAKAGTHAIIGVYPPTAEVYPIGKAMNKNLTVKMGNCNHRRYIPRLVDLVASGAFDPAQVLTKREPMTDAIEAYKQFDQRNAGWMKVELTPGPAGVNMPSHPVEAYSLREVARFEHQATGVAVSEDDRIFVNFPRWSEDAPVSVAELQRDGTLVPYPDERWNAWRNARKNELSPDDHWVCVQALHADWRGNLWVVDPAAPATSHLVKGGAKLVRIELASNAVRQTILFDADVAPEGSYLNDVRVSPDGRWAYITDSGATGALVVVDLEQGSSRRVLHGHPSTQPEPDVIVHTDGAPLRRPDGRGAEFAADGIALSRDGGFLYWQALTGRTLYRIATERLHDPSSDDERVADGVERVGENGVSDGLWIDGEHRMYISALQENAVKVRDLTNDDAEPRVVVQDERLRWPDTFAEGPDGTIYVTASHIQDMPWFVSGHPPQVRTELFRLERGR